MGISERNRKMTKIKMDEIIDGMEKALRSKSYDRLTIDDVAREAEYSKKTVYSYFRSKDEIRLALLNRKFNLLYEKLQDAIAGNGKRGIEKIVLLGRAYYGFAKEYPEYMQAIIDFEAKTPTGDPETDGMTERFNQETGKSFLLLEEAVKEAIQDKTIVGATDAASTAVLLWAGINGFITLACKKGEYIKSCCGKSVDELFNECLGFALRSLGERGRKDFQKETAE